MNQHTRASFLRLLIFMIVATFLPARADVEADTTMKQVAVATRAAQTLSADVTLTQSDGGPVTTTTGVVRLKKPNLARIELGKPFAQTIASDGKSIWLVEHDKNRYQRNDAKPGGNQVASFTMIPVGMFFDPNFLGFDGPSIKATRIAGKETVDGETYRIVEVIGDKPYDFTLKCFVATNDLVTRSELQLKLGDQTITFGTVLTNIRVNEPLADVGFAYAPPKGAVLYDLSDPDAMLIPVGEKAYQFSVPTPAGGLLAFEGVSKGKKAVLVNFWFHGCQPCRQEFPALQRLYDELKDKGLEVVALNLNDPPETITKYLMSNRFTFLVGMCKEEDPVWKEYRVRGCPTNYILDSKGNVIWRKTGFDEKEIRATLKKLGVQRRVGVRR